jgi:hypothetical protein
MPEAMIASIAAINIQLKEGRAAKELNRATVSKLSVNSAAVVRFGQVHRGMSENQEPDLGPVLPESTNPELDLYKWFGMVRSGYFHVRT